MKKAILTPFMAAKIKRNDKICDLYTAKVALLEHDSNGNPKGVTKLYKDIAKKTGVYYGTVIRVLKNRGLK